MKEKEEIKVSLGTVVSIIIIFILIIALGIVYYLGFLKDDENGVGSVENQNTTIQTSAQDEKVENNVKDENITEETTKENQYLNNFSESVSEELGTANNIRVEDPLQGRFGITYAYVNSNSEAYIVMNQNSNLYNKYGEEYKIADNVANIYIYQLNQSIKEYIFIVKKDGTVEYSYLESGYNEDDLTVHKIDKVKDVTNIIQIFGNDAEGIGGNGVLFITSDGNCLPYFRINRETIY